MNKKLTDLKNALESTFPKIKICGTVSDFENCNVEENTGLWVSAEESWGTHGNALFRPDMGHVDSGVESICHSRGYFVEFYDGGTVMIYED
jgi:hypothetical protein